MSGRHTSHLWAFTRAGLTNAEDYSSRANARVGEAEDDEDDETRVEEQNVASVGARYRTPGSGRQRSAHRPGDAEGGTRAGDRHDTGSRGWRREAGAVTSGGGA
jgi:hypothetical protein